MNACAGAVYCTYLVNLVKINFCHLFYEDNKIINHYVKS